MSDANNRYYDTETKTSFDFDHISQKASNSQSYSHDSSHTDLVTSLLKALSVYFAEHYPPTSNSAYTVCAAPDDKTVAILLSTTKASPSNFLSGRWRSTFLYNPATSTLTGTIKINVHYYEDGNVALSTTKELHTTNVDTDGPAIVRKIGVVEKQYQEEVNRAFVGMNEQSFKALRRQLPVTRQKVEWEKIRGYGLGSDLRGEGKQ